MAMNKPLSDLQATGYRLRKSHEKSRNDCLRCKQLRKKCDEARPKCSRCTRLSYTCQYQHRPNTSESDTEPTGFPNSEIEFAGSELTSRRLSSDRPSGPITPSIDQLPLSPQSNGGEDIPGLDLPSPDPLNATELNLLAHYLSHTSQTIPFDSLDLYALAVGVPNLAFKCKAVMSSLLSLAAACRCHDIANENTQRPLDTRTLTEINDLLALAERHHAASLRHIQATMQITESYDNVLANAALMVLYASASHSIRVHLAATAEKYGQRLPTELLPQHSQWISFTRAAHTASSAILNDIVNATPPSSTVVDTGSESHEAVSSPLSPQDGPSPETKSLFLPLVASTCDRALGNLRRRAERTTAEQRSSAFCSAIDQRRAHALLETITILESCASAALSPGASDKGKVVFTASPNTQHTSVFGCSRGVSPWVARYMISVTSMEAPQILRRIIMSFLNKAPTEFLNIVRSVLDSPTVKVMLLDGVWWISNIGQWELSQVISLMKRQNVLSQLADSSEMWWPESMYLVKRELTPDSWH
ncbi:transcriptional regulator family: Fungal Specific TF [Aspergillus niger]|nr:transcriptional regulator family: Fungal Specific TF [Aspergillus niger]